MKHILHESSQKGQYPTHHKNGRKSKWYEQPITVLGNLTKFADVEKMLFALKKYWAESVWPENTHYDDSGMQERWRGIFYN